MVSKYNYKKEYKNRLIFLKKLKSNIVSKALKRDNILELLEINSYITKIRNRCLETGSSRSVFSKYRMGRISFKKLSRCGWLNGIKKSSW